MARGVGEKTESVMLGFLLRSAGAFGAGVGGYFALYQFTREGNDTSGVVNLKAADSSSDSSSASMVTGNLMDENQVCGSRGSGCAGGGSTLPRLVGPGGRVPRRLVGPQ